MFKNPGCSHGYWQCYYTCFYRRSSWFVFKCWTGRSSESGGQTTPSEQGKENCNASGLDAEQVQEILSTFTILASHHAQPIFWSCMTFYTLQFFYSSWKLFFFTKVICLQQKNCVINLQNLLKKTIVLDQLLL